MFLLAYSNKQYIGFRTSCDKRKNHSLKKKIKKELTSGQNVNYQRVDFRFSLFTLQLLHNRVPLHHGIWCKAFASIHTPAVSLTDESCLRRVFVETHWKKEFDLNKNLFSVKMNHLEKNIPQLDMVRQCVTLTKITKLGQFPTKASLILNRHSIGTFCSSSSSRGSISSRGCT